MRNWIVGLSLVFSGLGAWGEGLEISSGLNVYSFDYRENLPYREDLQVQLKSTESATVIAPFLSGRWAPASWDSSYFRGTLEGTTATSHFDGTTLGGDPATATNTHLFFKAEADFYSEVLPSWFAFAGLGYSYWNRFLSGGSGYREIYTWGFIPLGIRYEKQFSEKWGGSFEASYRAMFGGQILVIFSETVIGGQDSTLTLGGKPGYRLQASLDVKLDPKWKFFLSPWYEFSEIGESNFEYNQTLENFIQEPSSQTLQFGIASGAIYQF